MGPLKSGQVRSTLTFHRSQMQIWCRHLLAVVVVDCKALSLYNFLGHILNFGWGRLFLPCGFCDLNWFGKGVLSFSRRGHTPPGGDQASARLGDTHPARLEVDQQGSAVLQGLSVFFSRQGAHIPPHGLHLTPRHLQHVPDILVLLLLGRHLSPELLELQADHSDHLAQHRLHRSVHSLLNNHPHLTPHQRNGQIHIHCEWSEYDNCR